MDAFGEDFFLWGATVERMRGGGKITDLDSAMGLHYSDCPFSLFGGLSDDPGPWNMGCQLQHFCLKV